MIPIKEFNDWFEALPAKLPAIKHVLVVRTEDEFNKEVKNLSSAQYPCLVVVLPSADGNGNSNNFTEVHSSVAYILTKVDPSSTSRFKSIALLADLQPIIEGLKRLLLIESDNPGSIFENLKPASLHTDPEYNYMGCDGWSLGFSF